MPLDVLVFLGGLVLVLAVLLWRHWSAVSPEVLPANAIVVDGSNVMHWSGDPSVDVIKCVLRSLEVKGFAPIVIFDASVGYRICDRYLDDMPLARLIGLPANRVLVVNKGVVADEVILQFATDHGLRVVTNDRYRDWRVKYPIARKRGALVRGVWQHGGVVWRHPAYMKLAEPV